MQLLDLCRASVLLAVVTAGCAAPVLSRDGQLVFQEKGARGATVITANGVEYLDRTDIPRPVVRRSVDEPWRPATGFLLPADGILKKTSKPVPIQGPGLAVVLRSSDAIVPSWGGEILLRLDAIAPAAAFPHAAASVRRPLRLVVVLDGSTPEMPPLADAAFDDLGASDRVGVIDSFTARGPAQQAGPSPQAPGARPVLPPVPGSHRTLLHAAVERLVAQPARGHAARRDLAGALALARGWVTAQPAGDTEPVTMGPQAAPNPAPAGPAQYLRRVLIITDGAAIGDAPREIQALAAAGVQVTAVGAERLDADLSALGADVHPAGSLEERREAVTRAVPPPGDVVLDDVTLAISSVPAPARVIEVSGGQSALGLYADRMSLGELYAGEARVEMARVMLPPWVPGETLELTVSAAYRDVASGRPLTATATLKCRYSSDVAEIAEARHGDVIAYASALAMVRRLHRAFLGSEVDRLGGLRPIASLQARSLASLARASSDPALGAQAEILTTLLGVIED